MSQRARIFAVLESKGWISNRDFQDMGLLHIGRNRITDMEAKDYFLKKGLKVVFVGSAHFLDHQWKLKPAVAEQLDFLKAG